ncbi:MAG: response regulator transcription factor [Bacteroidaceae bacterium]|nr:response regulator transcription factor [Bacteroidaceae bacterium]
MYKIIIADDHQIVTEGITRILEDMITDGILFGKVVIAVHTLADCLVACRDLQPDLLLLDVALKDGDGIDTLPQLQDAAPAMKTIILTSYSEANVIHRALSNGAHGYILKTTNLPEFKEGIKKVMNGETYICKEAKLQYGNPENIAIKLTLREKEILKLIVEGYTIKEISSKLCLGFETIHSYTKYLREKLHANNTASLVRKAFEYHLV